MLDNGETMADPAVEEKSDNLLRQAGFPVARVRSRPRRGRSFIPVDLEKVDGMCATYIGGDAVLGRYCPSDNRRRGDSDDFDDNMISLIEQAIEHSP